MGNSQGPRLNYGDPGCNAASIPEFAMKNCQGSTGRPSPAAQPFLIQEFLITHLGTNYTASCLLSVELSALCHKNGCGFVDGTCELMGMLKADGVHPTKRGSQRPFEKLELIAEATNHPKNLVPCAIYDTSFCKAFLKNASMAKQRFERAARQWNTINHAHSARSICGHDWRHICSLSLAADTMLYPLKYTHYALYYVLKMTCLCNNEHQHFSNHVLSCYVWDNCLPLFLANFWCTRITMIKLLHL
ncbi:uncharacterized protein LOC119169205 isoform X2 [Rhipicephalus microplus]|uniref:uncharacterized protein LOC119169205 isoform X2 n=1 Tax=Rhipicephalus microplus TaxID=6941 RepID=UPI003F6D8A28